jgi:hypothetical protein
MVRRHSPARVKNLDFFLVRAGGLSLCSSELYRPILLKHPLRNFSVELTKNNQSAGCQCALIFPNYFSKKLIVALARVNAVIL